MSNPDSTLIWRAASVDVSEVERIGRLESAAGVLIGSRRWFSARLLAGIASLSGNGKAPATRRLCESSSGAT